MKHYLLKIAMDENDADYLYGVGIVNQIEYDMVMSCRDKEITVNYDYDRKRFVFECIKDVHELTNDQLNLLMRLGLSGFGEFDSFLDKVKDVIEAEA